MRNGLWGFLAGLGVFAVVIAALITAVVDVYAIWYLFHLHSWKLAAAAFLFWRLLPSKKGCSCT